LDGSKVYAGGDAVGGESQCGRGVLPLQSALLPAGVRAKNAEKFLTPFCPSSQATLTTPPVVV